MKERGRMVLAEKFYDEAKKNLSTNEKLSRSSLKFEWKEGPSKKVNPLSEVKTKVGFTEQPYIKKIERMRNTSETTFKIGGENIMLIKKYKELPLKIGHPELN